MQCAVGSYTGDGTDNRPITGVGFRPDLVIIKSRGVNWGCFRTSAMSDDSTAYLAQAATNFAGGVKTLDSDGFTLGTHASVNGSGIVYDWQAFRDDGAGDFAVGSYQGDGTDNRQITGLGFEPALVCVKVMSTTEGVWRTAANSGDQTMRFTPYADLVNNIQAFLADGFDVGTAQNATGATYHWFAFRAVPGYVAVGSYVGDGTDNREITGVGFEPALVWVKRTDAYRTGVKPSTLPGDSTEFYTYTAPGADWVQALSADGFQVGTALNASGVAHRWAAWRVGTTPGGATPITASDAGLATDVAGMAAERAAGDAAQGAEQSLLAADYVAKAAGDAAQASEGAASAATLTATDAASSAEAAATARPVAGSDAGTATETAALLSLEPSVPVVDLQEVATTVIPRLIDQLRLDVGVFHDRVADPVLLAAAVTPRMADSVLLLAAVLNQEFEAGAAAPVLAPRAEVSFL